MGTSPLALALMPTEDHISVVLNSLAESVHCLRCGTRARLGDYECPHCGADLEDALRRWAEGLLHRLGL